ncbi:TonB-dependent receptor [Tamlana sp. 2_MG-2023]|uniref:TonB-dependent receptor domain-containing protein n=1 Tax=unclassified Tamlana TaxID=2614803 RepID=UPI0026E31B3D|nr:MULTISPECIES: TonB-dependent receptor [unclassified Tamlana]MDO6761237.1 TonB-dependent receptor [Tamlana sp. 2_MG-2023]MDO6791720.1 TonB-dependent receptor [Tamlana sp. 1_MG-2023]
MTNKLQLQTSFLLLFLLITNIVSAQIIGEIIDSKEQNPIEYGTVALYKVKDSTLVTGVITDAEGHFNIDAVKKGNYYLEASFIGYEKLLTKAFQVSKNEDLIDLGTLLLNPSLELLNEVVIQGTTSAVINKVDRQVFSTKNFQNSEGGNGVDILRNVPSVNINGDGSIALRGSTSFTLLLNGKPIQSSATQIIGQLPANAIERVEVITAPSAKYDPEGKSGILNIITKKGAANGAFTQINLKLGFPSIEDYDNEDPAGRYGGDFIYNLRKDKWNISLGASYQRNDIAGRREGDVSTIINDTLTRFPSDGERSFDEINYSGRLNLDYTPNDYDSFSLGVYAGKRSKDRRANILYYDNHAITPADGGEQDRVYTFQYWNDNLRIRKSDFVVASIDYSHTFLNDSQLSTSLLYEYTFLGGPTTNENLGYPDRSIILQEEYNTNDNPLNGVRFQADYTFKPMDLGQLSTGYQYRNLDHKGDFVYERMDLNTGDFILVPEFSSTVDLTRVINSGYVQLDKSTEKVDYSVGLRLESMNRDLYLKDKVGVVDTTYTYDFVKLYPSASVQYKINDDLKLKAAYSRRVDRTTSFKMNPFPEREHSETLEQGDPTLKPEFIDLVEVGVVKDFESGASLYGTAYYRDVKNLVNRVNTVYNDTILNRIYSNVGRGKSLGLELGSEFKITESWNNFVGANLYNFTIDGDYNGNPIDTSSFVYSLNINSTYSFSETASLQFNFNYLSDRVTAQGEDSQFYSPNLSFKKSFFDNQLVATLQWQNIDMGLLDTNEQRITTWQEDSFYTTTNYVYEVDMVFLNLTYSFNKRKNESKFIESEFGKREF